MSFLVDTNVVSEARRAACDPNVRAWFDAAPTDRLYLSVLVVGEIRLGIERRRRRDPVQAQVYENWLHALRRDFADRVIPITEEIAEEWGRMNASSLLPMADGLIAATARIHRLTVVTRNVGDFERAQVPVLNPFLPLA